MAQLPPDSHCATASQSFGAAAEAGAARTPRETAAAPPSTTAPRRRARAGVREDEDERMEGLPIRRLRGELSGSERSVPRPCVHGFTPRRPAGPATRRDESPTPVLAVQEVRRPAHGVRGYSDGIRSPGAGVGASAPAPGPGRRVEYQGNRKVTTVHLVPQGQPG